LSFGESKHKLAGNSNEVQKEKASTNTKNKEMKNKNNEIKRIEKEQYVIKIKPVLD